MAEGQPANAACAWKETATSRGHCRVQPALGQKRADAVKTFLEGLGISRNRLETISYGFERR